VSILSQAIDKVNEAFDENYLDSLARKCGFLKRKRKIGPKKLLENMLSLRIENSASSLDDLALEFKKQDCSISRTALHKKLKEGAIKFFRSVLDGLLAQAFSGSRSYLAAISFIKRVLVLDSSKVRLHAKLQNEFPDMRNQGATAKLQALIDVISNQVLSLSTHGSREPDQSYKSHLQHIQKNDLLMADLGYFCVDSFREVEARGGYFLSRFFKKQNFITPPMEKKSIYALN
jgi:hypothetical protein